jgi:demethylmenaquinone methyltransferase/2-methoxy-6-polyprenyl-1,4-benzoquinol methylase
MQAGNIGRRTLIYFFGSVARRPGSFRLQNCALMHNFTLKKLCIFLRMGDLALFQRIIASAAIPLRMLVHEGHARASRFFTPANAGSYDSLVRLATFGRDSAWKREIIKAIGNHNSVLELACGTGILSRMLAGAGKSVTGVDLTFEYLRSSRRKVSNDVAQGTAEVLPYRSESFEAVASSYLAKYVDIKAQVQECWRVLKPGGAAVFHDFTYPNGTMRNLWSAHFAMLRIAGRAAKSWKAVFEQLDDVIRNSHWVEQATAALYDSGFRNVDCKYYTAGTAAIVSAEKP